MFRRYRKLAFRLLIFVIALNLFKLFLRSPENYNFTKKTHKHTENHDDMYNLEYLKVDLNSTLVSTIKTKGGCIKDFDFTQAEMTYVVSKWREQTKLMNWNIVDILKMPKLQFLRDYKNPCFMSGRVVRCLPYFMILGVAKCGTTELYDTITMHPDVIRARNKEIFWFTRQRLRGHNLYRYTEKFTDIAESGERGKRKVVGDGTPITFWENSFWMDTPENRNYSEPKILTANLVKHINPNAKFILILRDPVERMYSDYKYFGKRVISVYKPTPEDFHRRILHATKWMKDCFNTLPRRHCLYNIPYRNRTGLPMFYYQGHHGHSIPRLRMGLYSEYLKDWLNIFPRQQFLILTLEEYSTNKRDVMERVFKHLELDSTLNDIYNKILHKPEANKNTWHFPPMLNETKEILRKFYRPFNLELSQTFGVDITKWI